MALDATNLSTVFAGVQQVHVYNSADAVATIAGSGYFNSVTNRLKQFDVIHVVGSTGGTATVDVLVVTSATGAATVTTTNGT
jgi:hypothetical protein